MAGTLARSSLRQEVRDNIKRTTGGVADSRINVWLNWGQERIADLHTYEEMRKVHTGSTVTSQLRYGFPTRMKDIFTLKIIDGASSRLLTYVHPRNFDSVIPLPSQHSQAHPDWYVDYGVNFELFPIPDATYTVELRSSFYPADFSADTSVSELTRKDQLIVCATTIIAFWGLREYEEARFWAAEYWPALLTSSLTSDHSGEDWTPVARPFFSTNTLSTGSGGKFWENPFIGR